MNIPGKSELTILKIILFTAPLSNDWRILTRKRRQRQRATIERINNKSPIDQSGQVTLANINLQYWSGTWVSVPLTLSFLKEQYRFNKDKSGLAVPKATLSIAFLSSWNQQRFSKKSFSNGQITWTISCVNGLVITVRNSGLELTFRFKSIEFVIAPVKWYNIPKFILKNKFNKEER